MNLFEVDKGVRPCPDQMGGAGRGRTPFRAAIKLERRAEGSAARVGEPEVQKAASPDLAAQETELGVA